MYLEIDGDRIFASTGGKPWVSGNTCVVFLHGSGMDHRAFALQTRFLAFRGLPVLAPDFPGHSLSSGQALESIEDMGAWLWRFLDGAGVDNAVLVGHSQGCLVALAAAALQPERVRGLSLMATGASIAVNDQLLTLSQKNQPKAVDAMLNWGFGEGAQYGLFAVPGQAPIGVARRIMCANPLAADLAACAAYQDGLSTAQKLTQPAQVLIAQGDRMTPPKTGQILAQALVGCPGAQVFEGVGHMLPIEAPQRTAYALRDFVTPLL